MSRTDPFRQVSMSAARAGSPAFTEGQNIEKRYSKPQIACFLEGGPILALEAYFLGVGGGSPQVALCQGVFFAALGRFPPEKKITFFASSSSVSIICRRQQFLRRRQHLFSLVVRKKILF